MKIELEKKYELTEYDHEIIKEKCEFIEEKEIIDYYLDDQNFTLMKADCYLRMRNGKYEYKIHHLDSKTNLARNIEIEKEEEIEKELKKFHLHIDQTKGVLAINTKRKKYKYNYKNIEFIIDIDTYEYGSRYEIELLVDDDSGIDINILLDELRNELGLISQEENSEGKLEVTAMHQNLPLYEILIKHNI